MLFVIFVYCFMFIIICCLYLLFIIFFILPRSTVGSTSSGAESCWSTACAAPYPLSRQFPSGGDFSRHFSSRGGVSRRRTFPGRVGARAESIWGTWRPFLFIFLVKFLLKTINYLLAFTSCNTSAVLEKLRCVQ